MSTIPVTIAAKNEAKAIGACLDSLLASARFAQAELEIRFDFLVVLDDCEDNTREVVESRGVAWATSTGGKVEAQRRGNRPGPFQIFSDADVTVTRETLHALSSEMLADERVQVAFPRKAPLAPRSSTPLAWALHRYNQTRGFSSSRTWFSGKLFAIRAWDAPSPNELARRAAHLPPSAFYDYSGALRVDDIYLSRAVLYAHGPEALRETEGGLLEFRAPEGWKGMYRYYRRMRRELERMDALYPEHTHARFGRRSPDLLREAPLSDHLAYALFQTALLGCRAAYRCERAYRELRQAPAKNEWPAIEETKVL